MEGLNAYKPVVNPSSRCSTTPRKKKNLNANHIRPSRSSGLLDTSTDRIPDSKNIDRSDLITTIGKGYINKNERIMKYSISQNTDGYCLISLYVTPTKQRWNVFIPTPECLLELHRLQATLRFENDSNLISRWFLDCTQLQLEGEYIIGANFDYRVFVHLCSSQINKFLSSSAIKIQSHARRYNSKKIIQQRRESEKNNGNFYNDTPKFSEKSVDVERSFNVNTNQMSDFDNRPRSALVLTEDKTFDVKSDDLTEIANFHQKIAEILSQMDVMRSQIERKHEEDQIAQQTLVDLKLVLANSTLLQQGSQNSGHGDSSVLSPQQSPNKLENITSKGGMGKEGEGGGEKVMHSEANHYHEQANHYHEQANHYHEQANQYHEQANQYHEPQQETLKKMFNQEQTKKKISKMLIGKKQVVKDVTCLYTALVQQKEDERKESDSRHEIALSELKLKCSDLESMVATLQQELVTLPPLLDVIQRDAVSVKTENVQHQQDAETQSMPVTVTEVVVAVDGDHCRTEGKVSAPEDIVNSSNTIEDIISILEISIREKNINMLNLCLTRIENICEMVINKSQTMISKFLQSSIMSLIKVFTYFMKNVEVMRACSKCLLRIFSSFVINEFDELIPPVVLNGLFTHINNCLEVHYQNQIICLAILSCIDLVVGKINSSRMAFTSIQACQNYCIIFRESVLTSSIIIIMCCKIVKTLSQDSSSIQGIFGQCGMCEALLVCMSSFSMDPEVLNTMCNVVIALCDSSGSCNISLFGTKSGVKILFQCLRMYALDTALCKIICIVINNVCCKSSEVINNCVGIGLAVIYGIILNNIKTDEIVINIVLSSIISFCKVDSIRLEFLANNYVNILEKYVNGDNETIKRFALKAKSRVEEQSRPSSRSLSRPVSRGYSNIVDDKSNSSPKRPLSRGLTSPALPHISTDEKSKPSPRKLFHIERQLSVVSSEDQHNSPELIRVDSKNMDSTDTKTREVNSVIIKYMNAIQFIDQNTSGDLIIEVINASVEFKSEELIIQLCRTLTSYLITQKESKTSSSHIIDLLMAHVSDIMTSLSCFVDFSAALVALLDLVTELCSLTNASILFGEVKLCEFLMNCLQRDDVVKDTITSTLSCAAVLAVSNAENKQKLCEEYGCISLRNILVTFRKDIEVIEKVSLFVVNICTNCLDNQIKIGEYNISFELVICLSENVANSHVVGMICCALLCLCNKCEYNQNIIGSREFAIIFTDVLLMHAADSKIFKIVCMTLLSVCSSREDLKSNFSSYKFPTVLKEILDGINDGVADYAIIQGSAIMLIRHFSTNAAIRREFLEVGLQKTIVRFTESKDSGMRQMSNLALDIMMS